MHTYLYTVNVRIKASHTDPIERNRNLSRMYAQPPPPPPLSPFRISDAYCACIIGYIFHII